MLNIGVTQMSKVRPLPLRAFESSGEFRPESMTTRSGRGVGAELPSELPQLLLKHWVRAEAPSKVCPLIPDL